MERRWIFQPGLWCHQTRERTHQNILKELQIVTTVNGKSAKIKSSLSWPHSCVLALIGILHVIARGEWHQRPNFQRDYFHVSKRLRWMERITSHWCTGDSLLLLIAWISQEVSWFLNLEIPNFHKGLGGRGHISSHNGQGLGGDADRICHRPVLLLPAKWRHQWNGTHTSDTTYPGSTFSTKLSEFRIFTLIKLSKKLLFQVEGVFSTF